MNGETVAGASGAHADKPELIVYYDGSCPLCSTEIEALDLENHGCRIRDCSPADFSDEIARRDGITNDQLMEKMHVRDRDGRWWKGVDAFVLMYHVAGRQGVSKMLARPRLRPLWDRLYVHLVRNRHWMSRLGMHKHFGALLRRR